MDITNPDEPDLTYLNADLTVIRKIGGAYYLFGSASKGIVVSYAYGFGYLEFVNSRPWLCKFYENGETAFSKVYDIEASFAEDILDKGDGNILFIGGKWSFRSKKKAIYLMTVDKDGVVVPPR